MVKKCNICNEEIKTTFLEKLDGTIIKKDSKIYHICSNCQKTHKNNLKEKLS